LQEPELASYERSRMPELCSDPAIECCRVARRLLRRFVGQLDRVE
jgi:hypothetical protein